MSGTGPKKKHAHQEMDGALAEAVSGDAHVCGDCSLIYQSPIILPLDKVKQLPGDNVFKALQTEGLKGKLESYIAKGTGELGLPIASPLKFYLSQVDPQEFKEKYEGAVLSAIAKDKRLVAALSSPELVGGLNADLVQHFINDRKLEFDFTHRAYKFFEKFRNLFGGNAKKHGEYDSLAERPENLGLASRYIRRMLNNPAAFAEPSTGHARAEIFSYLLPNLLAIADEKATPELAYARDKLAAAMIIAMGEEKLKDIVNPETYQVQVVEGEKGEVSVTPKPMEAENYKATSIDVFVKNAEGKSQGKVRYMGKNWDFGAAHFHTNTPEHNFGGGDKHKGEIHLVFKSEDRNGFLVLGAPIVIGKENPAIAEALAKQAGGGDKTKAFSFTDLLPDGKISEKNLSYFGSLTTTPYKAGGGVRFVLSKDNPLEVSAEQLAALEKIAGVNNSRKPQNWMGRIVTEIKGLMPKSAAPSTP